MTTPKKTRAPSLRGLWAQWHNLSPNLEVEPPDGLSAVDSEKWVRLHWTNEQLKAKKAQVTSWKELTTGQVRYLTIRAREQSGDGPAYRANLIGRLAVELWGSYWDEYLRERMRQRFSVTVAQDLAPAEARMLIEELVGRISRSTGEAVEAVRERVRLQVAGSRGQGKAAEVAA